MESKLVWTMARLLSAQTRANDLWEFYRKHQSWKMIHGTFIPGL